jgi:hypothetical protein
VFFQPDLDGAPLVMGFVSTCPAVGAYFGPKIFAGTPFESAPVLEAKIEIDLSNGVARSRVEVGGVVFETELSDLGDAELVQRAPAPGAPFTQQGIERVAKSARLKVDGKEIALLLPPVGISGGAPAVLASCGIYAR